MTQNLINTDFALEFIYDGHKRHVDNITFEPDTNTIIGFEMRKDGKFSYRIKRYSTGKISGWKRIDPIDRNGTSNREVK